MFDTFALSLVTVQSIARLGETVGENLDVRRFRPNILLAASDGAPFAEDEWVGSILCIGTIRTRIDKRDGRCVMIGIDPDTGLRNPAILRTVAQDRQGCLGVYGTVATPGRVTLDDPVFVEAAG